MYGQIGRMFGQTSFLQEFEWDKKKNISDV